MSIARRILRAPSFARVSAKIRRVSERAAAESVFDLTVERNATYQANGFMVSNSDAFGEFAVNCRIVPKPPPPPPKNPPDLGYGQRKPVGANNWKTA